MEQVKKNKSFRLMMVLAVTLVLIIVQAFMLVGAVLKQKSLVENAVSFQLVRVGRSELSAGEVAMDDFILLATAADGKVTRIKKFNVEVKNGEVQIATNGKDIFVPEDVLKPGTVTVVDAKDNNNTSYTASVSDVVLEVLKNGGSIDKDGNIKDKTGNTLDKDGTIVIDKDGNTLDKEGNIVVDKNGNILDKDGAIIVDKNGNLVTDRGGSKDKDGNVVDKNGNIIVDKDNNIVDKEGNIVVDKDGNTVIDKPEMPKNDSVNGNNPPPTVTDNKPTGDKPLDKPTNKPDKDKPAIVDKPTNKPDKDKPIVVDKPGNKPTEKPILPDKPTTGNKPTEKPDDKTVVDKDGNVIVDKNGNIVDKDGTIVVDKDGNTLDKEGNIVVDKEGNILDKEGNVIVDKDGNLIDKDSSVDAEGNIVDKEGNIVVDKEGNIVDKDGNVVVDKDSNIVDKEGNIVIDKDNNIVDGSGNVVVDKEDNTVVTKPEVPKGDNLPIPQPPTDNNTGGNNTNPPKPPVQQVTYTGLIVKTMPDKIIYKQGDLFDKTGLVLEAQYSDKTKKEVKDFTVPTLAKLMPSDTGIEVSYTDKGVTHKVRIGFIVEKRIATEIEVTKDTKVFKSEYIEGEKFSPKGLKVKITYDNKDVEEQIKTESQIVKEDIFVWSSSDIKYGQKIVEIWDKDKTIAQNVDITTVYKVPQSIEVSGTFKKDYIEEEVFDTTWLKALVKFNNGTEIYVDDYVYSTAEFSMGTTELDVDYTYQGAKVTTKITGITVKKMSPVKLLITKAPDKTAYKEDTSLDTTGMLVDVVYDNKKTYAVSDLSSLVITPATFILGNTEAVLSYTENGKTVKTTQQITVVEKELTGITIKTPPAKVDYIEEQTFDPAGLELTLTFDNGSTESVATGYTFAPTTGLIKGTTSVDISYVYEGGTPCTATQSITVVEKQLVEIAFKTEPTEKSYIEGQTFSTNGAEVTASWNNETETILKASDLSWEVGNGESYSAITTLDKMLIGYSSIRAKYLTKSTPDIAITVVTKKPISIKVTQVDSKHEYIQGQTVKPEEFKVEATFDNGTTKVIPVISADQANTPSLDKLGNYTYAPTSKLVTGNNIVTFSYSLNGSATRTGSLTLSARARKLVSIKVKTPATDVNYIEGQTFDNKGTEIAAVYDSGEEELLKTGDYTYQIPEVLHTEDTHVEYSYTADKVTCTVNQSITVAPKKLVSVILSGTYKTSYIEGQTFNNSGLIVTATFDNGMSLVVPKTTDASVVDSIYVVGNYNLDTNTKFKLGDTSLPLTYVYKSQEPVTKQIGVTVVAKKPTGLAVTTPPTKVAYIEEESFNPAGMIVTATYDNGAVLPVTGYSCSPSGSLSPVDNQVTISYTENGATVTTTQAITVDKKVVDFGWLTFDKSTGTIIAYSQGADAPTVVTVPESIEGVPVKAIGSYAFEGCMNTTSITLPNSIVTIGGYAFSQCIVLTSITLSNSVQTIGNRAFRDCTSLTSITLPNSVQTIGTPAFNDCTNLTRININKPQNSISGAPWGAPSATVYWQGQFSKNKLSSPANTYIDSPKNEEHKDCITCQGTGVQQEKCSLCLGTGKYTQEKCALGDKCDVCKHQTDVCPQCQGTGKGLIVKCKDCQGTGKQPLKLDR